jgi:hypothetical protein
MSGRGSARGRPRLARRFEDSRGAAAAADEALGLFVEPAPLAALDLPRL